MILGGQRGVPSAHAGLKDRPDHSPGRRRRAGEVGLSARTTRRAAAALGWGTGPRCTNLALEVGPSRSVAALRQPTGRARPRGVLLGGSTSRTRSNVTTSVLAGCRPARPSSRRRSGLGSGRSFRPATRAARPDFDPRLIRLLRPRFFPLNRSPRTAPTQTTTATSLRLPTSPAGVLLFDRG